MNAFRLPLHVKPRRYALELELDPERSARYQGTVRIELELARATRVIELHCAELRIHRARVRSRAAATTGDQPHHELRGKPRAMPARETLRVELPRALPKGSVELVLDFSGRLRRDLRGLYGASSGKHRYAFSQLEAADARRFFPCFDEPSFKARFTLAVTTSAKHTVVSNGPIRSRRKLADGRARTVFAETPLLSTYLVALGVGALEASRPVYAGKVPIRILHVPGQAGLTRFGLSAARACLTSLTRYFALPYPYQKLDLVAVPDFEIGAMENAGAVFFRETLLLLDEDKASLGEHKRAFEVICHELAHMWFGNLVTMAFWDDLWLNEAFATWIAFAIVDELRPDLNMWNDFGHSRASALELDALRHTHSVYAEVKTAAQATERFDLITYEKGAAVIRMLERYLGKARFRRGVRDYIRAHRGGNATAADLWHALERHAGDDVARVVRPWIEREGFPLVKIARAAEPVGAGRNRQTLRVSQMRFLASGAHSGEAPWPVPIVLRVLGGKRSREHRHLLQHRRDKLELPVSARAVLYGNADEGGFYHPLYNRAGFAALLNQLQELNSAERLGLVTHTWALARAGHVSLGQMVELACALGGEPDADVLSALQGPSWVLLDRVAHANHGARARLRGALEQAFAPALEEIGLAGSAADARDVATRRAELLQLLAVIAEVPRFVERARAIGARFVQSPDRVEPNLSLPALCAFARQADAREHQKLLERSLRSHTPQARRRYRLALADTRDPKCITRTLELCLTPRIPTQDVSLVLGRLFANPAARKQAFAFVVAELARLRPRLPPMLASRLVESARALSTHVPPEQVLRAFTRAALPGTTQAIRQLRERFALDQRLVRRSRELVS